MENCYRRRECCRPVRVISGCGAHCCRVISAPFCCAMELTPFCGRSNCCCERDDRDCGRRPRNRRDSCCESDGHGYGYYSYYDRYDV